MFMRGPRSQVIVKDLSLKIGGAAHCHNQSPYSYLSTTRTSTYLVFAIARLDAKLLDGARTCDLRARETTVICLG